MLKPFACLLTVLFSSTCHASLVLYYQAYLLEGQIGVDTFLMQERGRTVPDGRVTLTFELDDDLRSAQLKACKTSLRTVRLKTFDQQADPEQLSLSLLSLIAARTVSQGFGVVTRVFTDALAQQLAGTDQRRYLHVPYGESEDFLEVNKDQAAFILNPAQIVQISTLLHFFSQAPQNSKYLVMETEELVDIKWQLTSKTIQIKQQGKTSVLRRYVLPANKPSKERTTEEHRRQVDFRSGYQPVARLLPETGGSLQAANAMGLDQLLYYMPSINQQREPESVMGLSSFMEMSRHAGTFNGITKRCWLPELVETTSDSKVACLFSTQLTSATVPDTEQVTSPEDDDEILKCLTEAYAKSPQQSGRRANMEPLGTMLDESTRVSQIMLPGSSGFVNAYSKETSEWEYLLWDSTGVRLLLVKEASYNGHPFHNPLPCQQEEMLKEAIDKAMSNPE